MTQHHDKPGLVIAGTVDAATYSLAQLAVLRGWKVAWAGARQNIQFSNLEVQWHCVDLSCSNSIEAFFSGLTSHWKKAPAAILYSAHVDHIRAAVTESAAGWDFVQSQQLQSAFLFVQAGVREMLRLREGTTAEESAVVFLNNVSAARGVEGYPQVSPGAANAGLIGMTKQLAVEWGPFGVRVNMLQSGFFEDTPPKHNEFLRRVPLGRMGSGKEVAESCYYLLSKASSYVTGAVLPVDGGFLAT